MRHRPAVASLPRASFPAAALLALALAACGGTGGTDAGPAGDPGPADLADAADPGPGDAADVPAGPDAPEAVDPAGPGDEGAPDQTPADLPGEGMDGGPDAPGELPPTGPAFRLLDLANPGDVLAGATGPDGTAWLAGAGGLVLRSDGDEFLPLEPPTEADLRGVSAGGDAVFVAAASGEVWRWRAASGWTRLREADGGALNAVAAVSADEFWAVGDGGRVVHGTADGVADDPTGITYDLYGIVASEAGGVRAVGRYGTLLEKGAAAWVRTTIGSSSASLRALWRAPDGRMFAAGDKGVVVRHDGVSWKMQVTNDPEDPPRDLHALWGQASDDVLAAGSGGVVMRWDGKRWSLMTVAGPYGLRADLRALAAPSGAGGPPVPVAAGLGSALLRLQDEAWVDGVPGVTGALHAVGVEEDGTVVAVGARGLVMRGRPPRLGAVRLAAGRDLNAVALPWAVGDGGILALVAGGPPGAVESGTTEDLADVTPAGDAWLLAGRDGSVLRLGDGPLARIATRFPGLQAVANGDGRTWIAGDGGRMEVEEGDGWRTVQTGTASALRDLRALPGGRVLAVGDYGLVLDCDPAACTRAFEDPGTFLYGLGADGEDLLAVGWAGTMLRRRPAGPWERLDPGTARVFRAVAGTPGGGAVLVGLDGTFLLYGAAAEALP